MANGLNGHTNVAQHMTKGFPVTSRLPYLYLPAKLDEVEGACEALAAAGDLTGIHAESNQILHSNHSLICIPAGQIDEVEGAGEELAAALVTAGDVQRQHRVRA